MESLVEKTEDGQGVAERSESSAAVGSVEGALSRSELDELIEI